MSTHRFMVESFGITKHIFGSGNNQRPGGTKLFPNGCCIILSDGIRHLPKRKFHICIIYQSLIKSTQSGVILCFQYVSATAASSDAAKTFASHVKSVFANLTYLRQRTCKYGEMYWMTFLWPWPKVGWILCILWDLDLWPQSWPSTLKFSRLNFEISVSHGLLVWLMWNEKKAT